MLSLDFSKKSLNFDLFKNKNASSRFSDDSRPVSHTNDPRKKEKRRQENGKANDVKISAGTRFSQESGIKPYIQLACSRLFNHNGSLKLSYLPPRSVEANFVFPLFLKNNSSLEMNIASNTRALLNGDLHSRVHSLDYKSKLNLSFIYEILQETGKLFYMKINNDEASLIYYKTKTGLFDRSFFTKLDLYVKKCFELPKNFFYNLKLHIGTIYGRPHTSDRYFLGESIRGHAPFSVSPLHSNEKIGGLSCFVMSNNFGWSRGPFRFFTFTDFGFSSSQNNILETLKSTFRSILISFRPASFGISTGIGVSVNLKRTKSHSVDLTLSYGSASAKPADKRPLQLGIDLNIY